MYDVLIIGSGAAGLTLALSLPENCRIAVLSKDVITEGSTVYAQGGISAVLDATDSVDSHIEDTLNAGAGLCDAEAVRFTVENGATSIGWLLDAGVPFTREEHDTSRLHLTREGGHSHRRIAHAADASGAAIENTLVSQIRQRANITTLEHHIAVDLITSRKLGYRNNRCMGAYVLNRKSKRIITVEARFTVLATGGASKVYLYTSNPDGASGDGIAMAWRAGCRIANMEFMQFHPTCLYHPHAKSSLITEAVRGEGGRLLLPDGTRFMPKFDPRAELAPRDIVARAIDHEMKRLGLDCVYLDISHKPKDFILSHFPNVYATCEKFGYDMSKEPVPVVPAAHYTCGGVMVDQDGRTDVDALYCIGEASYTGLHGANRMASNSLLECVVYGKSSAEDITARLNEAALDLPIPHWDESRVTDSDERVVITHNWDEIRRFMWDYVGIVRTTKRLQRALNRMELLLREIDEYYANFRVTSDLIELRNLALVAWLIIRSALNRPESRGLHYTLDFPKLNHKLDGIPTVLDPITTYHPY
ncbi:L-aspartate oxidase [Thiothrix nivea]|uniref:L-aspartate oxidase n=1 Tax=Thiothrix nivea (strain ATCC 35100 / DSM 5205 / JP2) TaxID=870187 RepID=A0A656HE12_THINJ|nr:L-aspartate oxidase [Thiothrix nivea]EIJ33275.1 L-aspartate oxidase [Thiothrix nivea DSM 5205]